MSTLVMMLYLFETDLSYFDKNAVRIHPATHCWMRNEKIFPISNLFLIQILSKSFGYFEQSYNINARKAPTFL